MGLLGAGLSPSAQWPQNTSLLLPQETGPAEPLCSSIPLPPWSRLGGTLRGWYLLRGCLVPALPTQRPP